MDINHLLYVSQNLIDQVLAMGGLSADKQTLCSLAYATYFYIMFDRYNHLPSRRRIRRHHYL